MLKRLLWLSLCCAALLLLMGLMVRSETALSIPPRIQTQSAVMPNAAPLPERFESPERGVAARLFAWNLAGSRKLAVWPAPIPAQAFHLQNFQAFHYPDEAG